MNPTKGVTKQVGGENWINLEHIWLTIIFLKSFKYFASHIQVAILDQKHLCKLMK